MIEHVYKCDLCGYTETLPSPFSTSWFQGKFTCGSCSRECLICNACFQENSHIGFWKAFFKMLGWEPK